MNQAFSKPFPSGAARPLAARSPWLHSFRHTEIPKTGMIRPRPAAYMVVSPLMVLISKLVLLLLLRQAYTGRWRRNVVAASCVCSGSCSSSVSQGAPTPQQNIEKQHGDCAFSTGTRSPTAALLYHFLRPGTARLLLYYPCVHTAAAIGGGVNHARRSPEAARSGSSYHQVGQEGKRAEEE